MPRKPYDPEGTVETIVKNGLCTECGFCEPVCPTNAIELCEDTRTGELLPKVNAEACVMCPLCLAVCPGEAIDFDKHFREYIGTDSYKKYEGYIENAFLGWSSNESRRFNGASGGVIIELAKFALTSGRLDYILFARPRPGEPFRSETILTSDPDDLNGASGSLYYPVPLGEGFGLLLERGVSRNAKLGLIGLPCHIHGAHKIFDTGRYKQFEWHLIFGVFCGGTWSYKATDRYLEGKGLRRSDVVKFAFRGGGWPGSISFETRNGSVIEDRRHKPAIGERIAHASIFSANSFYTPHRCLTCSDGLADLADISFGDPWLKSQKGDKVGKTLVVTRTAKALDLLMAAEQANVIALEPLDKQLVVVSQKSMLTFKQNYEILCRIVAFLTGRRTPRYNYNWASNERPPRAIYLYGLVSYVCHIVGRRFDYAFLRVPLAVLRGIVARVIKDRLIRLTVRDSENYFSR